MKPLTSVLGSGMLVLACGGAMGQCRPASIVGVGTVAPSVDSRAWAVSADGTTVVGELITLTNPSGSPDRGFQWTRDGGLVALSPLPNHYRCYALGVNANGSIIVGTSAPNNQQGRACVWYATGVVDLNPVDDGSYSYARAVSADGTVAVGQYQNRAARWVPPGVAQDVGGVPPASLATAASANGSVVVGLAPGFRWSVHDGFQFLSAPCCPTIAPQALSADGATMAGSVNISDGRFVAFRWIAGGNLELLGLGSPSGAFESAMGMTPDATVVVGEKASRAFVWTAALGQVDLNSLLAVAGANLAGWTLTNATGVSADATTISGYGLHEYAPGQFRTEAWVATIPVLLTSQPDSQRACLRGTITVAVTAKGYGPLAYQWRHNGVVIADDSRHSGASTPSLTITNFQPGDVGEYQCVVSNGCGLAFSQQAAIVVACMSVADVASLGGSYGCDGLLTADDVAVYLAAFFDNSLAVADLVGLGGLASADGAITPDDLVAFLAAFFAGCP